MSDLLLPFQVIPTSNHLELSPLSSDDLKTIIARKLERVRRINCPGQHMSTEEATEVVEFLFGIRTRLKPAVDICFMLEDGHSPRYNFNVVVRFSYGTHHYKIIRPIEGLYGRHTFIPKEIIIKLLVEDVVEMFSRVVFLEDVKDK